MADLDLSNYTTIFRATQPRRTKRNRPAVSCCGCRARKSKCDRQQPCGACRKRGEGNACRFETASNRSPIVSGRHEIRKELRHMQDMLQTLLGQHGAGLDSISEGPAIISRSRLDAPIVGESVRNSCNGTKTWADLSASLTRIQTALDSEETVGTLAPAPTPKAPDVVFGSLSPATTSDVLEALPSRQTADRIIAAYFNAKYVAVPFIHAHQFRRQYEAFWESPATTNLLWVSILFSVFATGAVVASAKGICTSPSQVPCDSEACVAMSARCLLAGEYLKAEEFSVEALVMHAHSRYIRQGNSDATLSSLYGLAVRLAQRRGYHCGSAELLFSVTPFEAEMRRRVWFVIQYYDVLFSFEQGIPPLIHEDVCHSDHPTNIVDDDFDEDTQYLYPRPLTDSQPILACVYQSRLLPILRRIIRHTLGFKPCTYSDAVLLSNELETWYASIPPCLRIRPIRNTSFTDPNHTVMHRIMLELMYTMGKSILYRPFLDLTRPADPECNVALDVCRRMAMRSVGVYVEVDREMQMGGRLHEDRYISSSLTTNDFFVATILAPIEFTDCPDLPPQEAARCLDAMQAASHMLSSRGTSSVHALHAARALRVILATIQLSKRGPLEIPYNGPCFSTTTHADAHQTLQRTDDGQLPEALDPDINELAQLDMSWNGTLCLDWNSIDRYLRSNATNKATLDHLLPDTQSSVHAAEKDCEAP